MLVYLRLQGFGLRSSLLGKPVKKRGTSEKWSGEDANVFGGDTCISAKDHPFFLKVDALWRSSRRSVLKCPRDSSSWWWGSHPQDFCRQPRVTVIEPDALCFMIILWWFLLLFLWYYCDSATLAQGSKQPKFPKMRKDSAISVFGPPA